MALLLISLVLLCALAARLCFVLPVFSAHRRSAVQRKGKAARTSSSKTVCVVLGSGGHTAEMVRLLRGVDFERYSVRQYIVGDTDMLSLDQIGVLESGRDADSEDYLVCRVPRSRSVGQSWLSTPISVLNCLVRVAQHLYRNSPDVVLCNGPGNCVLVCMVAFVPRILGIKRIPIIYVESFARVRTLSLSGKIIYLLADRFIVQWASLRSKYPRAEYIPNLV